MKLRLLFLAVLLLSTSAYAYSADYLSVLWEASVKETMSGFDVADIDGDGALEVVVSASSEGGVYAFDGDGTQLWRYGTRGYANFVRTVDIDGDGDAEILAGTGSYLYVIGGDGVLLWRLNTGQNIVDTGDAFDVTGDGVPEVLYNVDSESCNSNGIQAVYSDTHKKVWRYNSGSHFPRVIKHTTINNEPVIIVGFMYAGRSMAGCVPITTGRSKVLALDGQGNLLWEFNTSSGVIDLEVVDIDGDGSFEIAVASRPYLHVLDDQGFLVWEEDMEDRIDDLSSALLNNGESEVLAATYSAHVFDPLGTGYTTLNTADRAYSILSGDINHDGDPEYIIGSDRVYIYEDDGNLLWNSSRFTYVGYLFIGNIDSTPDIEIVAGADKKIYAFKLGLRGKIQEADAYYNRAKEYYTSGKYDVAFNYAEQAMQLYYDYEQDASFKKTRDLMDLINEQRNSTYITGLDAKEFYDKALGFYGKSDFINASLNAQIAKAKYVFIGDSNGSLMSEELLNKSRNLMQINASFSSFYAQKAYDLREYDLALSYADNARLYQQALHNSTAVMALDDFISEVKTVRGQTFMEKLDEFLNQPSIRRFLYVSEYDGVNKTLWFLYLVVFGLFVAGIAFVFKKIVSILMERAGRETLNLDQLEVKESPEVVTNERKPMDHAKFAVVFFAGIVLLMLLIFVYLLFIR